MASRFVTPQMASQRLPTHFATCGGIPRMNACGCSRTARCPSRGGSATDTGITDGTGRRGPSRSILIAGQRKWRNAMSSCKSAKRPHIVLSRIRRIPSGRRSSSPTWRLSFGNLNRLSTCRLSKTQRQWTTHCQSKTQRQSKRQSKTHRHRHRQSGPDRRASEDNR